MPKPDYWPRFVAIYNKLTPQARSLALRMVFSEVGQARQEMLMVRLAEIERGMSAPPPPVSPP